MSKPVPALPAARLVLEDGLVARGRAFGCTSRVLTVSGEVVFNTAMTGYQEAISDPSYTGQILTMTAPQIGNYGIAADDDESEGPKAAGVVIRELSGVVSSYRAVTDLSSWLDAAGIAGIEGLDTRALVRRIRTGGAMRGVLSTDAALSDDDLVDLARQSPLMAGRNLVTEVAARSRGAWTQDLGGWWPAVDSAADAERGAAPLRVVALDCGAKRAIYRHLVERGCEVIIVPAGASAGEIRELSPDGLFISNGPGDPAEVRDTIAALSEVAGEVPTFGICLGHQLLALALGAKTYKLPFGHRGANQPVRSLRTGCVEITSQNHGFCVDAPSLESVGCEVTHVHLNDGTAAGLRHSRLPIFSVQYHPEASPGPHDSSYLFDEFVAMMRRHRLAAAAE